MTMPEILVVVAIIAIMSAVVVPTFSRMGLFSRDDMKNTAHDVFSMVKAAKIYAATYRVVAAAAYYYDLQGAPDCLRAIALVYEHPYLKVQDIDGSRLVPAYFPVPTGGGDFKMLAGETCVMLRDPVNPSPFYDPRGAGFSRIALVIPGASFGAQEIIFPPAHVFLPSGRLRNTQKEMFTFYIGFSPAVDMTESYYTADDGSLKERYIPLGLYRATGRLKLEPEEG